MSAAKGAGARGHAGAPLILKCLAVTVLLPEEVSFRIEGLFLSPARLLLLVLAPVLLSRAIRLISAGNYRFVLSDILVLVTGLWILFALLQTEGLPDALTHGGPLALEFCGGYMATRLLLSRHGQAVSLINFLCCGIGVVGILGIFDTLTGQYFTHELMRSVFGGRMLGVSEYRLGLLRATSSIIHPILFGMTCAFGFLISAFVPIKNRIFAVAGCGTGLFLALSSAPMQGIIMAFFLLSYNMVAARFKFRWVAIAVLSATTLTIIFMTVSNPLGYIFNHLTFDAQSAYFRIYIWEMATVAVKDSPWVGWGMIFPEVYDIPGTVDSIWLVWALHFGIPASVLLGFSLLLSASLPAKGPGVNLTHAERRLGTILGILIFLILFLGFTVHFYDEGWIIVPMLAAVRTHLGVLGAQKPRQATRAPRTNALQPTT
jgi:hypothetical protein